MTEHLIYHTGESLRVEQIGHGNYEARSWFIQSANGTNIQLTFGSFDLEDEYRCGYDALDIYEGNGDDPDTLIGSLCGK